MIYIAQGLVALDPRAARIRWDPVDDPDLVGYEVYEERGGLRIRLHAGLWQETTFTTPYELSFGPHTFWVAAVDRNMNRAWTRLEVVR